MVWRTWCLLRDCVASYYSDVLHRSQFTEAKHKNTSPANTKSDEVILVWKRSFFCFIFSLQWLVIVPEDEALRSRWCSACSTSVSVIILLLSRYDEHTKMHVKWLTSMKGLFHWRLRTLENAYHCVFVRIAPRHNDYIFLWWKEPAHAGWKRKILQNNDLNLYQQLLSMSSCKMRRGVKVDKMAGKTTNDVKKAILGPAQLGDIRHKIVRWSCRVWLTWNNLFVC